MQEENTWVRYVGCYLGQIVDDAELVCDTKSHNIRVKVQHIDYVQVPNV